MAKNQKPKVEFRILNNNLEMKKDGKTDKMEMDSRLLGSMFKTRPDFARKLKVSKDSREWLSDPYIA
jgi:hypothetical protein